MRLPVYLRPPIHEDATGMVNDYRAPWRAHISGSVLADAARVRRRDVHSSDQVTFRVVASTEPTLSMPMLVANGHRLVQKERIRCKVLTNNENVYIRIDVWAACHECPPSWVRCLSPESVERRTTPESTTITKTRKGFEQFESRANWSCGQPPLHDAGRH